MWNNISSSYWLDLTVSIITDVHPVVLSLYISICPQQQQQKVLKTSMTFQRLVSKQLSHEGIEIIWPFKDQYSIFITSIVQVLGNESKKDTLNSLSFPFCFINLES